MALLALKATLKFVGLINLLVVNAGHIKWK